MYTKLRRAYYHIRHRYVTTSNIVMVAAGLIALSWAWGSVEVMQRNYELQQRVDAKRQELQLSELEVRNLEYEAKYFESFEYQDLTIRQRLGFGAPGEKALIVPTTDDKVKVQEAKGAAPAKRGNFQQWMNFLFGGERRDLQNNE